MQLSRGVSMAGLLLALLLSVAGGASRIADAHCDMVEVNHYQPDCGGGFGLGCSAKRGPPKILNERIKFCFQ